MENKWRLLKKKSTKQQVSRQSELFKRLGKLHLDGERPTRWVAYGAMCGISKVHTRCLYIHKSGILQLSLGLKNEEESPEE